MDITMRTPSELAKEFKKGNEGVGPEWTEWFETRGYQIENEFLGHLLLRGDFEFTVPQRFQLMALLGDFVKYLMSGELNGDDYYDTFMDLMYMFLDEEDK